jgi:TnpA family transposase
MRGDLLRQPSAQMRKDAPALRLGPAAADTSLKRFTRRPLQHPTSRAIPALGQAIKTVLLCPYLPEEALRRARHAGCQVVAHWQSAHAGICLGQGGAIATHRCAAQALAMLSLQL